MRFFPAAVLCPMHWPGQVTGQCTAGHCTALVTAAQAATYSPTIGHAIYKTIPVHRGEYLSKKSETVYPPIWGILQLTQLANTCPAESQV